jgi:hypothetical protein
MKKKRSATYLSSKQAPKLSESSGEGESFSPGPGGKELFDPKVEARLAIIKWSFSALQQVGFENGEVKSNYAI